jgi:hypothetical protein
MAGWEYQVIHINVEAPRPPGPPPPGDGPAAASPAAGESSVSKPMFSENFLKKEFPQFYEKPPTEGSASQAQHPAHQLQTFLNGHGVQGWELIGVFPVGNLTMMFFRRPKRSEPKPASPAQEPAAMKPAMASEPAMAAPSATAPASAGAPASAMASASAVGSDAASGPAAEAADNAAAREGSLHEVLRRLEQIEERLRVREDAGESPTPTGRQARTPRDAGSAQSSAGRPGNRPGGRQLKAGRSEARSAVPGERVTPAQLANLADATPLTSSRAAQAIGLRSAASLANHGARYGYAPGLSKRGPNGLVAIYTGSGTAEKGGNERRLWIVVPAQRLEG